MHFKENAEVLTPLGEKVGRLERVVVDPGSGQVTHLVVKKGVLFTEDKVVPLNEVEVTTAKQVVLKSSADDPDRFPKFEETHYIPEGSSEDFRNREAQRARRVIWYQTQVNTPFWATGSRAAPLKPLYIKRTRRNIPKGSIPLDEGASVLDVSENEVGRVEEIFAEPQDQQVTHILISKGILAKKKRLIPIAWVKDIFEDSIRLTVKKEFIESLPEAG
jgi:uncharacterized protein YrrD